MKWIFNIRPRPHPAGAPPTRGGGWGGGPSHPSIIVGSMAKNCHYFWIKRSNFDRGTKTRCRQLDRVATCQISYCLFSFYVQLLDYSILLKARHDEIIQDVIYHYWTTSPNNCVVSSLWLMMSCKEGTHESGWRSFLCAHSPMKCEAVKIDLLDCLMLGSGCWVGCM